MTTASAAGAARAVCDVATLRALPTVYPIHKADNATLEDLQLSVEEQELLREVILAVRGIAYGNLQLTMHDGHFVELTKIIRVRKQRAIATPPKPAR